MAHSILVLAAEPAAGDVAHALRLQLGASVETASDRRACVQALRRGEFTLLLVEESLTTSDPEAADMLYEAAGTALVVEVNFGISSADRVLRLVRGALARSTQVEARARAGAALALHNELNAALTGLLLESQLALRQASPELAPALQQVVKLAGELRDQLRV